MQANELLAQLHDIQLPDPVGWWPLAFSWWIMIFSVTSILIGFLWYYLDLKRRNAYRLKAQQQLKAIRHAIDLKDTEKVAQINRLLKQVALTAYGRNKTASLQSQEWVGFLAQNCNYIAQPQNLTQAIELGYRNPNSLSQQQRLELLNSLADYAAKWIKGHHQ